MNNDCRMSLHMVAHTATITVTIIQDNEGEKEKKRKKRANHQIPLGTCTQEYSNNEDMTPRGKACINIQPR